MNVCVLECHFYNQKYEGEKISRLSQELKKDKKRQNEPTRVTNVTINTSFKEHLFR